jgi:hypothetical protein
MGAGDVKKTKKEEIIRKMKSKIGSKGGKTKAKKCVRSI